MAARTGSDDGPRRDYYSYGLALEIEDGQLVVGNPDLGLFDQGGDSVELFRHDGLAWQRSDTILEPGVASATTAFGSALALDDGVLVVGSHKGSDGALFTGEAHLYAVGGAPRLFAGPDTLAVGQAEAQAMGLHGCRGRAGAPYLVLGSLSGTAPGPSLGGLTLPLVVDAYTALTLSNPGATLTGGTGVLDGQGRAQMSFHPPASAAGVLAGLEAYHAALVLDVGLAPESVSNAVSAKLEL